MRDDNYRWGDDPADHRALDAWITREPDHDEDTAPCIGCDDGVAGPGEELCPACLARHEEERLDAILSVDP